MSSLLALPDEVLLNILSQVIEVPDDVRMSASKVNTYTRLFAFSAIHVNRKLRELALSAIAGSVTWVELNLSHGVMNQHTGAKRWGTVEILRVPALFETILPPNRPTIRISIVSEADTTSSKRTHVFPFHLEALLSFPWLGGPVGRQRFDFIIDCGLLTLTHQPIISRYIVPLVEALRSEYKVKKRGLIFTARKIPDVANRDDQSLLGFVHDYARSTLRNFLFLSKSHNVDGAAVLIHKEYSILAD